MVGMFRPAGHFFNGFTWRLKLTVKPPDPGSPNEMNIHVGLCWGIEVEGEGPLPLSENTMVQVWLGVLDCASLVVPCPALLGMRSADMQDKQYGSICVCMLLTDAKHCFDMITLLQVDFDIATWDFVLHEEDPTSSEGPVVIKAGTCWGWVSATQQPWLHRSATMSTKAVCSVLCFSATAWVLFVALANAATSVVRAAPACNPAAASWCC